MSVSATADNRTAQSVIRYYKASHKSYVRVWSGSYDQSIHFGYYDTGNETHAESMIRMNEVACDLAGIGPDDTVVDAGCGFGGSTVWLAENAAKSVYGVNIVPHQVEMAKDLAASRGVSDRATFLNADFADIPLGNETADVFWALESTVHAPDRAKVLAEAFRILKPGGRIMVVEYFLRSKPPVDPETIPGYQKILSGWAMPSLITVPDFSDLLLLAGFDDVRATNMTDKVAPSLKRMKRIAGASLYVSRPLAALGLYDPDRVDHAQASVALADAHLSGQFEYVAMVARKPETASPEAGR